MAKIFERWIRTGKLTLDDVPERWRDEVEALLGDVHEVTCKLSNGSAASLTVRKRSSAIKQRCWPCTE